MYGVVIVEDEELERRALRTILSENVEGISILGEAGSGAAAIAMIDGLAIDVMLVDINIPTVNGLDVIRHLRERCGDTRVVIITAYDYFEISRAAIPLGVDAYLLKPIRTSTLVSTVKGCIQKLGAGRLCREVVDRLAVQLDAGAYREGVALVRRQVEWIFSQKDYSRRSLALMLSSRLLQLAQERGLRPTVELVRSIRRLEALGREEADGKEALAALLAIVDFLFDVSPFGSGGSGSGVHKALNYIERNLTRRVSLEDAADYANVSSSYLSRAFKKSMGVNFLAYLSGRRIDLAKELLKDANRSITSISTELSFNDVNYFCKSFKKNVGVSPSGYRQRIASVSDAAPQQGTG